jgi:hypothetical protein
MRNAERDRAAYALARQYLLRFASQGVTPELLELYVNPDPPTLRPATISGVYQRILASAANRGMSQGVIVDAIGAIENLAGVLCDFDPAAIAHKYADRWVSVLDAIVQVPPRRRILRLG